MDDTERKILLIVYKPESECDSTDRKIRAIENEKCKASFVYFLKYVKIIKPPTQDDPGGIIPFQLWEHTKQAIKILLTKKLFSWLKSRQIGASWLVAAYVTWYAMSKVGSNIILMSKGEIEAIELLKKCYLIYDNLPDFMKLKVDPKSLTDMGFPIMKSNIKVLAATKTAGVSFTASVLVCDEHQDHPFAEQNYFAAKPIIDAGGQFISIFTQSGETLDTLANTLFIDAMAGINGFAYLFTGWQAVPNRTQKWYNSVMSSIPKDKLLTLTPELYMRRNYPATVAEALMPIQTTAAFNLSVITNMMENVRNFIQLPDIDTNIIHVYKPFNLGDYFVASTDTAHGLGKDYSVTVIMNVKTGEIVADILNNLIPPEELAYHSIKLLELYKSPLWVIEANDYGGVTISTAQRLGYKNFYEEKGRIGFITDNTNRPLLWGSVIPAINNNQITIYNKDGLQQFFYVIRNADKLGRIEGMKGRNDDYPLAVGLAWFKKDEVQTGIINYKPVHSLTFNRR
jgi:hypothetical protein